MLDPRNFQKPPSLPANRSPIPVNSKEKFSYLRLFFLPTLTWRSRRIPVAYRMESGMCVYRAPSLATISSSFQTTYPDPKGVEFLFADAISVVAGDGFRPRSQTGVGILLIAPNYLANPNFDTNRGP